MRQVVVVMVIVMMVKVRGILGRYGGGGGGMDGVVERDGMGILGRVEKGWVLLESCGWVEMS